LFYRDIALVFHPKYTALDVTANAASSFLGSGETLTIIYGKLVGGARQFAQPNILETFTRCYGGISSLFPLLLEPKFSSETTSLFSQVVSLLVLLLKDPTNQVLDFLICSHESSNRF
jgi:hypothetical protein